MGMWAEQGIYTEQPVPGGEARLLVMFLLLKPRGSGGWVRSRLGT